MPQSKPKTEYKTSELVTKAEPTGNPDLYANHAQVSITANELFLDFYYISPKLSEPTKPVAKLIQRVVVPIGLGKGFTSAIANVIANFEAANNITLPLSREPQEEDRINLWS